VRSFKEVDGLPVVVPGRKKPKRVGWVRHVLVAPDGKHVVGLQVDRPDVALMIERSSRFLALDKCRITSAKVVVADQRDAWDGRAAKRLDLNWEKTVIWRDMPVRTESGEALGRLADAAFDAETGTIGAVRLSGGAVADSAVGVRDIETGLVRGFDGEAIVVADTATEVDLSGGVADRAGQTAAAASVMAGEVASVARDGAVELAASAAKSAKTAAAYGKSAAKVAASSETGKKAIGWLKAIRDEVADKASDDEDG
jgi:uncharacterized protein YrrD